MSKESLVPSVPWALPRSACQRYRPFPQKSPDPALTDGCPGHNRPADFHQNSPELQRRLETADGKKSSLSIVSTYKLTDKDYSEIQLYVLQNDELTGKGLTYDFSGQSRTVPISMQGGSIKIKMPFDPATVTFSGNKIIGVADAMFTDDWEKIQ